MDGGFELPVRYKGEELMLPGQLHIYGYTQKIEILVHGVSVFFERDDAGEWRGLLEPKELEKNKALDVKLLQAIAASIEEVLK